MTDDFYRAFEERFYAPREVIKSLRRQYLPLVAPLAALYPGAPTFDIGCGRGEWLELMAEQGFAPYGIDRDESMLRACIDLGLPARQGDAVAYLESLEDESQALLTAFHVVEHLTFDQLRSVISQSLRVLKPAGLLIMETPNPENVLVATHNFYLDPTHQRPLPAPLLAFVAEHAGFATIKTMRLHESTRIAGGAIPSLEEVLCGASPDYAIVAQKASVRQAELAPLEAALKKDSGVQLHELASRYDASAAARISSLAVELDRLKAKVDELGCLLEQQTSAQRAEIDALRGSWSWRITAPLRWVSRPIVASRQPTAAQGPIAVGLLQRPLVAAMREVLRDPGRSYRLNQLLLRFPWLHGRLVALGKRAGIYPGPPSQMRAPEGRQYRIERPRAEGIRIASPAAFADADGAAPAVAKPSTDSVLALRVELDDRGADDVFGELAQRLRRSAEATRLRQRVAVRRP